MWKCLDKILELSSASTVSFRFSAEIPHPCLSIWAVPNIISVMEQIDKFKPNRMRELPRHQNSIRNPVNSLIEVGSLSPIIYRDLYIPGGCFGFLPSTVLKSFILDKFNSFSPNLKIRWGCFSLQLLYSHLHHHIQLMLCQPSTALFGDVSWSPMPPSSPPRTSKSPLLKDVA